MKMVSSRDTGGAGDEILVQSNLIGGPTAWRALNRFQQKMRVGGVRRSSHLVLHTQPLWWRTKAKILFRLFYCDFVCALEIVISRISQDNGEVKERTEIISIVHVCQKSGAEINLEECANLSSCMCKWTSVKFRMVVVVIIVVLLVSPKISCH